MENWPFRSFFSLDVAKSTAILIALAAISVFFCALPRQAQALDALSAPPAGDEREWDGRLAAYASKGRARAVPATGHEPEKHDSWSIFHHDERCTVSIYYPQMDDPFIDGELTHWADVRLRTFVSGVAALGEGKSRYTMGIDYTLSRPSLRFVSVVFRISTETGGARPDLGLATFTYDMQHAKPLQYADIFSDPAGMLAFCSQYARNELIERLPYEEKSIIYRGTAPNEANFAYFALRHDGVEIFFPPYQVARSSLGEQNVVIPLEKLKPYGPNPEIWGNKK